MNNSQHSAHKNTAGAFLTKCMICGEKHLFAKKMHYNRSLAGHVHKRCLKDQASLISAAERRVAYLARRPEVTTGNERPVAAAADNRRSEDDTTAGRRLYPLLRPEATADIGGEENHETDENLDLPARLKPNNPFYAYQSEAITDENLDLPVRLKPNNPFYAYQSEAITEIKRPVANNRWYADKTVTGHRHYLPPIMPTATVDVGKEDRGTNETLDRFERDNTQYPKDTNARIQMEQKLKLLKDTTDLKIIQLKDERNNEKQRIRNLKDLIDTMDRKINQLMEDNNNKEQEIRHLTEISSKTPETPTPCSNCGFLQKEPLDRNFVADAEPKRNLNPFVESAESGTTTNTTWTGYEFPMSAVVDKMRSETGGVPFDLIVDLVPAEWAEFVAIAINGALADGADQSSATKEIHYMIGILAFLNVFVVVTPVDDNRVKIEADVTEEDFLRKMRLRFAIVYDAYDGHYQVVECPVDGVEVTRKVVNR